MKKFDLDKFLKEYNNKSILDKCRILYNLKYKITKQDLCILLTHFNNEKFHLSEIKTLLVLTKPIKRDSFIKKKRKLLYKTYLKMKNYE